MCSLRHCQAIPVRHTRKLDSQATAIRSARPRPRPAYLSDDSASPTHGAAGIRLCSTEWSNVEKWVKCCNTDRHHHENIRLDSSHPLYTPGSRCPLGLAAAGLDQPRLRGNWVEAMSDYGQNTRPGHGQGPIEVREEKPAQGRGQLQQIYSMKHQRHTGD